ncbi:MAG: ABC transporter ATP-binding protein [Candidatus Andersenbacteria bacterium]|nr:ABC transporter ATP-binding protein [Candidatus Andersenbacteria bacterium]
MKRILKAMLPSIYKEWKLLVATSVSMVLCVWITAQAPFYVRQIVSIFESQNPDVGSAKQVFQQLLLVFVAINIIYRIFDYCIVGFETKIMRDLEQRSFAVIQTHSLRFFEESFSGSIVKSIHRLRDAAENISDCIFMEAGRSLVMLVVISIILAKAMPSFAVFFFVWAFIFLALAAAAVAWKYPMDIASAMADSKVGGALNDSISNHLSVKSFGQEKAEQKRFNDVTEESYRLRSQSWYASNIITGIQGLMMAIAEVGLIWLMIDGWEKGNVKISDFIFFQSYMVWMLGHLWSFSHSLRNLFRQLANAQEMADIFALTPDVRDPPGAHPLNIQHGKIEFDNATFGYATNTDLVLQQFNLTIPAGQSVGIVGITGAGKSTIMKLLMRFWELGSGSILIDEQDITCVTQESLRQQVVIVPQKADLFHRSIRENIAFGSPNATEEDILEAASQAFAWEFIEKLPRGLDTIVGERGVKLSGGQAQRIIIARAILADPKILILDEATSALDSQTEKFVQKAIASLLPGRTVIAIAHRLSTLRQLDRTIVVDKGKIIESGSHDELLANGGLYSNLWQHQIGGYIA